MQKVTLYLALAMLWLLASPAAAQTPEPELDICVQSFDAAQSLVEANKLIEAKAALEKCSAESCPRAVTAKCLEWLDDVHTKIPTVLIAAKTPDGAETLDVKVMEGDTVLAERLDGTPIALDPGEHTLTLLLADATTVTRRVVLQVGEAETLEVAFEAVPVAEPTPTPAPTTPSPTPTPAPEEPGRNSISPLVYVGFGLAGAGIIVGAIAGAVAAVKKGDIEELCDTQGCTEDDISEGETIAHVSTGGFAAAGVGAVLGLIGILVSGDEGQERGRITPIIGPTMLGVRVAF